MTRLLAVMYGVTIIGAAANLPTWAKLAAERFRSPDRRPLLYDRYFMVRAMLALCALGVLAGCGFRVVALLGGWQAPVWLLTIDIGLIALSEAGLIWTAGIGRASRRAWWTFLTLSAAWAAFVVWMWA